MFCLCYVSTRESDLDDDVLRDILVHSRKNNQLKNLTGLLLLVDNKFIQILEGEKEEVLKLYKRILNDNRHNYIKRIFAGEIPQRNFNNWAMAFHELHWEDLENAGLVRELEHDLPLEEYLKDKNHYIIEFLKTYSGISELQLNLPN